MRLAPRPTSWLTALALATLLGAAPARSTEPPAAAPQASPAPAPNALPAATTGLPQTVTLHSFKVVGNQTVSTSDIEDEMSIKMPSWLPWKKAPTFRLADLEYNVELIKRLYRRQGFYHTKIKPEVQHLTGDKVNVTLVIDEGPWVKVTEVKVKIENHPDLSDLENKWPLNEGDRFTEKAYDGLKNLYLNYLPNHGYPRVTVEGKVLLDEKKNTARVHLTVNPGAIAYFGNPTVTDAFKLETPEKAILEKLTFKPGDLFVADELFKTQRQLYSMDLFRSVVLTPVKMPPSEHHIPILVQVEEKKKRSLKVGLGYGDEDQVRARLGLTYRNLLGGGRLLNLDGRYSALGYLVSESLVNPVVFGSNFDLVHQSGARRRDLPGFTDQAYFNQVRLEHDLPYSFRIFFGHGLEFSRPFSIPVQTLIRLQGTESEKIYRASFALFGLRRDTVDNHISPTKGGTINWANELAPTFLGSGLQYVQTVFETRRYHAIGDYGLVLAGRVKFGLVQPMQSTSQIPIQRRFFSGGANSVRGYKLDYLGPRNASGDPIGGDSVLELSLEARYPLPFYNKKIGMVVFMDAGNVYLDARHIDPFNLKYSPGVGLRYLSPIGPVGVDVAFPVNRISYTQDRVYQIHFTIGYGF